MKKNWKIMILVLFVTMFFPVNTLAFGNYRQSYKTNWSNNYTDYAATVSGNLYQVSDGVVVLNLSHDLKILEDYLFTFYRHQPDIGCGGSFTQQQLSRELLSFIDDNIKPVVTVSKYDDMGNLLWKDEFTDGFSVSYGVCDDADGNVYVIGLTGIRKYDRNGKLISTNNNVTGYTIYRFGDYYAVFDARVLDLYEDYKESLNNSDGDSKDIDTKNLFSIKFYDKNFKLVKKINEDIISLNPEVCIDNGKLYYLVLGDKTVLKEVDFNLKVSSHPLNIQIETGTTKSNIGLKVKTNISLFDNDNNGSVFGDNKSLISTLIKSDDGFYVCDLFGLYKIDNNYNLVRVVNSQDDVLIYTGMIKRDNYLFAAGVHLDIPNSDDSDDNLDNLKISSKIKIYNTNLSFTDEYDINKTFDFKDNNLDNSATVVTRIVNLRDGFVVTGTNAKKVYSFIGNVEDYRNYLNDKYPKMKCRREVNNYKKRENDSAPVINYPETINFLLRYGDGYQIKTNVIAGSGRVALSKSFSSGNEKILYTVVPDTGYAVEKLRVYTVSGKEIAVVDNSFEMPDEDVIIDASFRKLDNPNTSSFAFIWIVCIGIIGYASYVVFRKA